MKNKASHETITSRAARVSGFLGLQRSTVGVLAMVVLVGMGERCHRRKGMNPPSTGEWTHLTVIL
jgi:hypothetical protein